MVKYGDHEAQLDLIFHALADRTRRKMLDQVSRKTCTVTQLAEPHEMSLPAISKHLKVLERAGLIVKTKDGRIFRCAIDPRPLQQANDLIAYYQGYWNERFDALTQFMERAAKIEKGASNEKPKD